MWNPDLVPCGLCRLDSRARVVQANATLAALLEYTQPDLLGLDITELLSPGARVYHQLVLWPRLLLDGRVRETALVLRSAQGADVHVLLNATRRGDAGEASFDCALFPLEQRKAIEDRLLNAERTVDQLPGVLFRLLREPSGRYRLPYASPRLYELACADSDAFFDDASRLFDAIHPADRDDVKAAIERSCTTLRVRPMTMRLATQDGQLRWLRVHCSVRREFDGTVLWQGSLYDVTQQQLIDERLREVDKLQAVATLAAGVAHDFNNVLGAITGLAELCEQEADDGGRMRRNLRRIVEAAGRASALVRQLLDFSRQTPQQMKLMRASELLQHCQPLLSASLPPHVRLQVQVDDDLAFRVDPVQFEQVLHNLMRNAAYAMRKTGGTVRIVIDAADHTTGAPMVRLRVIDHGEGVPPEIKAKIFEPFFTTKPLGAGTGLGLSAAHGIVTGHGGHLSVDSQPGQGSVFTILLPRAELAPLPSDSLLSKEPT